MGVRANLAPDLSARMPAAPPVAGRALLRSAGLDPGRQIVGLALTAVNPSLTDAVLDAATMDAVPDVEFCFIETAMSAWRRDDRFLAGRLQRRRSRLAILDTSVHPAQVLSAFGALSAVVAMRYHAMLFAERAGVPLVPVVYAEDGEMARRAWH